MVDDVALGGEGPWDQAIRGLFLRKIPNDEETNAIIQMMCDDLALRRTGEGAFY